MLVAHDDLQNSCVDHRLNIRLYEASKPFFSGTVLREILQAEAGIKVSRLVAPPSQVAALRSLAVQFGFSIVEGTRRYKQVDDTGKGGFSNTSLVSANDQDSGVGFFYVSRMATLAEAARDMEELDDSEGFGALLGIPPCCRKAYDKFRPQARKTQGDLLPQVWANTSRHLPFDPWLNVAVRYFGTCLISFFPCSFHCTAANAEARRTYALLSACNKSWARSFLDAHYGNVLYTEMHGVHHLRNRMVGGVINYDSRTLISTEDNKVGHLLRQGNRLRILTPQHVVIERGVTPVGSLSGGALRVCVFRI